MQVDWVVAGNGLIATRKAIEATKKWQTNVRIKLTLRI